MEEPRREGTDELAQVYIPAFSKTLHLPDFPSLPIFQLLHSFAPTHQIFTPQPSPRINTMHGRLYQHEYTSGTLHQPHIDNAS